MRIEKRSIPVCVLLEIVTCGIYGLYWIYKITDDLYKMNGEENKAGIDVVLSIVTCGIYFIYLNYKWGKQIDFIRCKHGLSSKDESVLYLVLCIFGFSIVNQCIIQSAINTELADAVAGDIDSGFHN